MMVGASDRCKAKFVMSLDVLCQSTSMRAMVDSLGVGFASIRLASRDVVADVTLNLWDTGGQRRFRTLAPSYYRGADELFVLIDPYSLTSAEHTLRLLQSIQTSMPTMPVRCVVFAYDASKKALPVSAAPEGAQTLTADKTALSAYIQTWINDTARRLAHRAADDAEAVIKLVSV